MTGGGKVSGIEFPQRYVDRKTHGCGCVLVWDKLGTGFWYESACSVHRRYAERYMLPRE